MPFWLKQAGSMAQDVSCPTHPLLKEGVGEEALIGGLVGNGSRVAAVPVGHWIVG